MFVFNDLVQVGLHHISLCLPFFPVFLLLLLFFVVVEKLVLRFAHKMVSFCKIYLLPLIILINSYQWIMGSVLLGRLIKAKQSVQDVFLFGFKLIFYSRSFFSLYFLKVFQREIIYFLLNFWQACNSFFRRWQHKR